LSPGTGFDGLSGPWDKKICSD